MNVTVEYLSKFEADETVFDGVCHLESVVGCHHFSKLTGQLNLLQSRSKVRSV